MSVDWEVAHACGVCGADGWDLERTICGKRYGRCRACGLVRLLDRVAERQLSVIYDHYYDPATGAAPPSAADLSNPTFAFRLQRLEAVRGHRPRRFFEIGCGDGNFLAVLRAAGWVVSGSEYGSTADSAARRHGLDVRPLDVVSIQTPPEAFPAVGAYHVLEHMYDPRGWLAGVSRLLEPSGLLHLQVPNYAALCRRLTGEAWASWRLPEHVYFYTPRTLCASLDAAGFEARRVTTWDPWHGPGTASASLANLARMRLAGGTPWTADVERTWPAAGPAGRSAQPRPGRRPARAALDLAARALAAAERVAGRGAVVDVVAVKR